MLNTANDANAPMVGAKPGFPQHFSTVADFDLNRIWTVLHRRRRVVLFGVVLGVVLALLYALLATPRFTAVVDILIEPPKIRAVADLSDNAASLAMETGGIDSQVEVLKSERIATRVIEKLDLKNNPTYNPPPTAFGQMITNAKTWVADVLGMRDLAAEALKAAEQDRIVTQTIVGLLGTNIDVRRVGRTYVIEVRYTDDSPSLASRIANTIANQYLVDQLDAKYDATSRAAIWLQDRIGELRERSLAADTKVQAFRAENGLITAAGKLVDEQQLQDANTALSDARAKVAETEARFKRMEAILKDANLDAAVTESLSNTVVATLRTKYLDTSRREAEISKKLGRDHVAAVNLRNEMQQYERLRYEERSRNGESYRNDYQVAQSRLESLEQNLKTLVTQTASNNQTLVHLRELERESDTYKALYQSFLTRYQEAVQQQSFPINDARVISSASPPLQPSWPKKTLVVAFGAILGSMLGLTGAVLLELRDRAFRTGEQIQRDLSLEFLGLLPSIDRRSHLPSPAATGPQEIGSVPASMRHSLIAPLSGFAETLRASKVAADIALRGKPAKVIGIVSIQPEEGKSTVAKNMASLLSSLGARTILIDADLRNPGLSRALAPNVADGLVEVLQKTRSLSEVTLREPESGLTFLPAVIHRRTTNSSELLSSAAMRGLLARLGESHDYIVVDLPPIGPVIDVRAAADLIDAFVLVVEWGVTPRSLVRSTLELEAEVTEKCLGVVLNKVDQSKMKFYEGSEYRNYSYSKYSRYYTS